MTIKVKEIKNIERSLQISKGKIAAQNLKIVLDDEIDQNLKNDRIKNEK